MAKNKDMQNFSMEQQNSVIEGAAFDTAARGQETGKQTTASIDEQLRRKRALTTRGRKGCKMDRMNVAMTPENYEYILYAFPVFHAKNSTEFINNIIAAHREEPQNKSKYQKFLKLQKEGSDK